MSSRITEAGIFRLFAAIQADCAVKTQKLSAFSTFVRVCKRDASTEIVNNSAWWSRD
jgi:hypothetical protein